MGVVRKRGEESEHSDRGGGSALKQRLPWCVTGSRPSRGSSGAKPPLLSGGAPPGEASVDGERRSAGEEWEGVVRA